MKLSLKYLISNWSRLQRKPLFLWYKDFKGLIFTINLADHHYINHLNQLHLTSYLQQSHIKYVATKSILQGQLLLQEVVQADVVVTELIPLLTFSKSLVGLCFIDLFHLYQEDLSKRHTNKLNTMSFVDLTERYQ